MARTFVRTCLVALGLVGFSLGAQAGTLNYFPCLDVEGQGFAGMPCTVGPDDFDLSPPHSVNDTQLAVETVLDYLFGEPVAITGSVTGLEGDQPGFDFNVDDITKKRTVTVKLDQSWTFATVKASTYWVIFDVRGLTEVELTTVGYIVNDKNGKGKKISHVSFWNPDNGNKIPVPATLVLLGGGLIGLGLVRRRRF